MSEEITSTSVNFSSLVAKLQKKKPSIVGNAKTAQIIWCKTESPQMNYMLGKGIPTGRMIRFRGPASSGKSITANYFAAQLQKNCPIIFNNPDKDKVIYIDFECTFEEKFASQVGVDTTPFFDENGKLNKNGKFLHLLPDDIEEASDAIGELINSGQVAAIVFDSDAEAPPRIVGVDPAGKANFGAQAKALKDFLLKYNGRLAKTHTTLLWISQERCNQNAMAHLPSVTGGEAVPFYASIILRITRGDDYKGENGDVIGYDLKLKDYKNKCATAYRSAKTRLNYNGGFDSNAEYIDFMLQLGYITQAGAYFKFTYNGEDYSIQGRKKLLDWLLANPEYYDRVKLEIDNALAGYNEILDKDNVAQDENGNELDAEGNVKTDIVTKVEGLREEAAAAEAAEAAEEN